MMVPGTKKVVAKEMGGGLILERYVKVLPIRFADGLVFRCEKKEGFQDDSWASSLVKCDAIIETGTPRGELGCRLHRDIPSFVTLHMSRLSDTSVEMFSSKLHS